MGVDKGVITLLGVSDLVGDLCDMSLAHLALSIMGFIRTGLGTLLVSLIYHQVVVTYVT